MLVMKIWHHLDFSRIEIPKNGKVDSDKKIDISKVESRGELYSHAHQ